MAIRIRVYGLKNCDTCRKARKWLNAEGIEHEFVDLRETTPTLKTLQAWHADVGDSLLNRRGTTWRSLPEAGKSRAEKNLPKLVQEYPALIKRPVLVTEKRTRVGFNPTAWQKALK